MAQAKSKSTTPATVHTAARTAPPAIDPATFPDRYALTIHGDCLTPTVRHGDEAIFTKLEKPAAGDLVVIWLRPDLVKPGEPPCMLKRLVLAPPSFVKAFPWTDHPASDVRALIVIEQLNPPQRFSIMCADIVALHRFVGTQPGRVTSARQ
jgi:hypothetical protein